MRHYAAVAGPLAVGGAPVALSAVAAAGRRWPARSESEVLEVVAASLGTDVAGFVHRVVRDRAFRSEVTSALPGAS